MPEFPGIDVARVPLDVVGPLRELYRRGMNCQIVHDSLPGRGLSDTYSIRSRGTPVGYGCLSASDGGVRDVIHEFYVLPDHLVAAPALFRRLTGASGARVIEAQTNDPLLTLMLFDCARDIACERILFRDALATHLSPPGVTFRKIGEEERWSVFAHEAEPVGDWGVEVGGKIVATGGIMLHYNPPWADLFMEVAVSHRRRGCGSFLLQELKRVCCEMGRTPAARCNAANAASRATLQRAGLMPCAQMLRGVIA